MHYNFGVEIVQLEGSPLHLSHPCTLWMKPGIVYKPISTMQVSIPPSLVPSHSSLLSCQFHVRVFAATLGSTVMGPKYWLQIFASVVQDLAFRTSIITDAVHVLVMKGSIQIIYNVRDIGNTHTMLYMSVSCADLSQ